VQIRRWSAIGQDRDLVLSLASLALAAALGPPAVPSYWQGVVKVDAMIHEPGGYHPYVAAITLRLREGERLAVPGGFRVPLVIDGGVNDVRTSVHLESGLEICSGVGREALPKRVVGYLESMAGRPATYRLAIPRAFGAFACGKQHATRRDRVVLIGQGDPEAAEIETADAAVRTLEPRGADMHGAFGAARARGPVRYEYKISWSLTRE
jgi:hypothetical protein